MSRARNTSTVSREAYFEYEESIEGWAEYYDGKVVHVPVSTPLHANLSANVLGSIVPSVRGKGCKGFSIGLRIALDSLNCYFHADATIVCGPLHLSDYDKDSVSNPLLVVEVLSPTTATRDRGEKFQAYQALESLQEYVLVEQDAPQVYVFTKSPVGEWVHQVYSGLHSQMKLNSLAVSIPLANIYYDVVFPDPMDGKLEG